MIVSIIAVMFIFGCAGVLGTVAGVAFSHRFEGFDDGPQSRVPSIAVLIAGCVALGLTLLFRHAAMQQVGVAALIVVPLVAIWYTDSVKGIVPDALTLVPLAVIGGYAVVTHDWWIVLSAAIVFAPFASFAAFSKGVGMGWGDAKLAALGGAILGMQSSLLAFSVACFVAVIVSQINPAWRKKPIAFAPYLSLAIAGGICLGVH